MLWWFSGNKDQLVPKCDLENIWCNEKITRKSIDRQENIGKNLWGVWIWWERERIDLYKSKGTATTKERKWEWEFEKIEEGRIGKMFRAKTREDWEWSREGPTGGDIGYLRMKYCFCAILICLLFTYLRKWCLTNSGQSVDSSIV